MELGNIKRNTKNRTRGFVWASTDIILLLTNSNLSPKICYGNIIDVALLFYKVRKRHTH